MERSYPHVWGRRFERFRRWNEFERFRRWWSESERFLRWSDFERFQRWSDFERFQRWNESEYGMGSLVVGVPVSAPPPIRAME